MLLTPQQLAKNLAAALHLKNPLYLKREDLHPLGSHKGRSIPPMIQKYAEKGWRSFVISSSGNAALAAILAIKKYNQKNKKTPLSLTAFVGPKIDKEKLRNIKKTAGYNKQINILQVNRPKQTAFQIEKSGAAKTLRQSADDTALLGYASLAEEIAKIKNLSAVFIPTSSGATAQGLHKGFKKLRQNPQIHIAQTDFCHPFVEKNIPPPAGRPLASAIVDKVAHRKSAVLTVIKNSHGNGWIVSNKEITLAIKLLEKTEKISISPNSALSLAGLVQAIYDGWRFPGAIVLLCTGK